MVKSLRDFEYFTVFLKNRNFASKIKRSKVTDYAALKMPCVGIFVVHFIYTLYALCIETKRNCVNHNKGKVSLKIFPWDSMSSSQL